MLPLFPCLRPSQHFTLCLALRAKLFVCLFFCICLMCSFTAVCKNCVSSTFSPCIVGGEVRVLNCCGWRRSNCPRTIGLCGTAASMTGGCCSCPPPSLLCLRPSQHLNLCARLELHASLLALHFACYNFAHLAI